MLEHGWIAHYTNRRYGHGLLPDTFEAYKRQRHRWAFGGLQLLRKHWRRMLPGADGLTREQKREYGIGWLNWLGSDSIGVVVALLNILWVPVVAFANIAVPDRILTMPIIAAFAVSVAHFVALYRLRVRASPGQMLGAVCAAMAVQWTVARAVGMGVIKERVPFLRTAKGGMSLQGSRFPGVLGGGDRRAAADRRADPRHHQLQAGPRDQYFRAVLVVQSLPFLAAVVLAAIEGTRFNSFAYWRGIEAKAADLLPQPQQVIDPGDGRAAEAAGRERSKRRSSSLVPERSARVVPAISGTQSSLAS